MYVYMITVYRYVYQLYVYYTHTYIYIYTLFMTTGMGPTCQHLHVLMGASPLSHQKRSSQQQGIREDAADRQVVACESPAKRGQFGLKKMEKISRIMGCFYDFRWLGNSI